ncbi:MAG: hypothetical protein EA425_03885, partial [Puniceicoccaceae bacterium]
MKIKLFLVLMASWGVGLSTASALEHVIWRYNPSTGSTANAYGGSEPTETPGAFIGHDDPELGVAGMLSNWAGMTTNSRLAPSTPLEHIKLKATITSEVAMEGVRIEYRFRRGDEEHAIKGLHVWTVDLQPGTNTFETRLDQLPAGEQDEAPLPLPVEETFFITHIEMLVSGLNSPTVFSFQEFTMSVNLVEAFNLVPAWRIDPFGGISNITNATNYVRTNNPETTSPVNHADFGFVDEVPHNPALADGQFQRTSSDFGLDGNAWGMAFFDFSTAHMVRPLPENLDLDRTFFVMNIHADF